jgi:hypothetical protein
MSWMIVDVLIQARLERSFRFYMAKYWKVVSDARTSTPAADILQPTRKYCTELRIFLTTVTHTVRNIREALVKTTRFRLNLDQQD